MAFFLEGVYTSPRRRGASFGWVYMLDRRIITFLILGQLTASLIIAIITGLLSGHRAGLSALLGGGLCTLGSGIFALLAFRHRGARAAKQIVRAFYKAEALKIVLTILLFIVILKTIAIVPLPFFIAFALVQMIFWLSLLTKL